MQFYASINSLFSLALMFSTLRSAGECLVLGFQTRVFLWRKHIFTLCPCFPGSPASPLTPLWPFNQTENKTINIVGGTNMIFNIKQNT